jgi:non-homologous end joining protein Ku
MRLAKPRCSRTRDQVARPANVVNLMDALRRSVEGETGKGKVAEPASAKKAKAAACPKRKAAKG